MSVKIEEAAALLERTPSALESLLGGLPESWLACNEGPGTWTADQVVAHLVEAEKTNWMPRLEWMLREGESRPFPLFDREAHLRGEETDEPRSGGSGAAAASGIERKLAEFRACRADSLARLRASLTDRALLERVGMHPELGRVKVGELLATWTVHDLTHLAQITRVMAVRYRADVGPWSRFFRRL
ncbi:DinB family protein [Paenibacillus sp. IB182496]|uniref:DinB family protein n=1 Tax=Paenibacillus sabuli TaxID=2772509 RepID=A0A927BTS6_9BACL|nr:DinB family protein [Paenibacillus sabuli]MBD2846656.1 DinB family protein [Paenibacillus sabuli]